MSNVATIEALFALLLSGDTSVIPVLEDAILEGVSDAGVARYSVVDERSFTRDGVVRPAKRVVGRYTVVTPGKSIRIVGLAYPKGDARDDQRPYDRTFVVGDVVEYDSFNLTYHGTIKSIGATVAVTKEHSARAVRLDLDTFTWRNYDLDLEASERRNSEMMMSL